jgi:predicted enzyme related to lactoylglutathione lyase
MPVRDSVLGEPCWVDLMSPDAARARDFYTELFGWTVTEAGEEYGGYTTFWKDGEQVAGLAGPMPGSDSPNAWMTYLAVSDADATTDAARGAGAQVMAEPMTVGSQGRMSIIVDPSGGVLGIWQSDEHTGYARFGEVGTPVWHELNTRDFDGACAFYEKVFGWELKPMSDTEEFRYSTFGHGDVLVGGIFDADTALPAGVPSHWQLYLGVPDVAAAASRVTELGGTVVREPWDTEFGTFAQVTDPLGAMFVLSSVE